MFFCVFIIAVCTHDQGLSQGKKKIQVVNRIDKPVWLSLFFQQRDEQFVLKVMSPLFGFLQESGLVG